MTDAVLDTPSRSRRDRDLAILAVVIAVVPIAVAVVRSLLDHWVPVNDNAIIAVRAQDVFSAHFPVWGTASSVSAILRRPVSHPGPLQFVLLAVPVRVLGAAAGLVVGTALLNAASIALVGWVAYRRTGLLGTVVGTLCAGALAWSMGSALLVDPWGPHTLILPTLAFFVLVWALADRDLPLLPLAVFVGSFLVQTHLSTAYLVPVLLGLGGALGWRMFTRPHAWRWALAAVVVGVVVWAPPISEELSSRSGNITRLVEQARDPSGTLVGPAGAARLTAEVLARPPFWLRDSMRASLHRPGSGPLETVPRVDDLPVLGTTQAAVRLGVLVAGLGALAWVARRRCDRTALVLTLLACAAIVMGWFTTRSITTSVVGVAPHQFRFLWSVGAFAGFALLLPLARFVPWRQAALGVPSALLVVVSVANLPAAAASGGPQVDTWAYPVVRAVDRQLGAAARFGPILADWNGVRFGDPLSAAFTAELNRRGIPFVVSSPFQVRHYGAPRRYDGHNARMRIIYRDGPQARRRRIGEFRRIAFRAGHEARTTVGVFVGPVDAPIPR